MESRDDLRISTTKMIESEKKRKKRNMNNSMAIVCQSQLGSGKFRSLCKTDLGSLAIDLVFSLLSCLNPISRHAGAHVRLP